METPDFKNDLNREEQIELKKRVLELENQNAGLVEQVEILNKANADLVKQIEDLSEKAYYDRLTGLRTRFSFDEELNPYFENIFNKNKNPERRDADILPSESVILGVIDIDNFKVINDDFNHMVGDEVLKAVSNVIKNNVRKDDLVCRWGGEEIIIAFIGSTNEGAELKTNFIRQKISELVFEEYPDLKVTISAGLANASDFKNRNALFEASDGAMYKSKKGGKNRVTFHLVQ